MPDLIVVKFHTGNFVQGQTDATYTISVSNGGSGPTNGTVTMVDTLPAGLAPMTLSGTGWNCDVATSTCTRSDVLGAAASYPAITLTVKVANNAPASVTNTATVSGGGELNTANDTATNVTTVNQVPDLTVSKTHSGSFVQNQRRHSPQPDARLVAERGDCGRAHPAVVRDQLLLRAGAGAVAATFLRPILGV